MLKTIIFQATWLNTIQLTEVMIVDCDKIKDYLKSIQVLPISIFYTYSS